MPARHHVSLSDPAETAAPPRPPHELPKSLNDISRRLDLLDERLDARLFQLEQRLELRTRQTMQNLQDGFATLDAVERRMTWLLAGMLVLTVLAALAGMR